MKSSNYLSRGIAYRAATAGLAAALAFGSLGACSTSVSGSAATSGSSATSDAASSTAASSTDSATTSSLLDASEQFTDRDLDGSYDDSAATHISLSDSGITVEGDGASVNGSTLTISKEGTYVLTGSITDGQVVVSTDASAKVQMVLAGADITSSISAAIYVESADKVFLTIAEGTNNHVSTTGAYAVTDEGVDAAVYAKDDLTINGTGTLEVTSAQGEGINAKDDLKLCGGDVAITATDHAIDANDSVRIANGSYTIKAGVDGIHVANSEDASLGYLYLSGGTLDVTAQSNGFDAGYFMQVDDGVLTVSAGDDGLHAEYDLLLNGGDVTVTMSSEALEGSTVTLNGGTYRVTASDDGINASGDPASDVGNTSDKNTADGGATGTDPIMGG